MKLYKNNKQTLKLQDENEKLTAELKRERAKTDYIAMMTGVEVDFKEGKKDDQIRKG